MSERDYDDGTRPEPGLTTAERTTAAGLCVLAALGVAGVIAQSMLAVAITALVAIGVCFSLLADVARSRRKG